MVVSTGEIPSPVYVHRSYDTYDMVGRFPLNGRVYSLVRQLIELINICNCNEGVIEVFVYKWTVKFQ